MGHPRERRLVQSMTRTLAEDFPHVRHFTFMTREIRNILTRGLRCNIINFIVSAALIECVVPWFQDLGRRVP
jgi:hypothetical protein